MDAVIVFTTVGADFDAQALATSLVEQRLAACVNIFPRISSVYRWENAVTTDDEQLLLIKTASVRVDALRDVLFAMHPYDVPEFVVVRIDAIEGPYRDWLIAST